MARPTTLRRQLMFVCLAALLCAGPWQGAASSAPEGPAVQEVVDVAPVWPGHPVDFCLLTAGRRQYVAYYDAERRLTVATRRIHSGDWSFQILPTKVGWDSHNGIALALDRVGCLHVAANMHVARLVYFRTERAHDIATFVRVPRMVGRDEDRCTYPRFLERADGALVFYYRDGESGRGRRLFNVYDERQRKWTRLLESPLLDGLGKMNAYPLGPSRGPDGRYHLVWMWRDTPDCRSNHDISYARSRDLLHWETAAGKALTLPITPESEGCVVDPVASGEGLINMGFGVGFDSKHRPIVHYHKYDEEGRSQIFDARFQDREWRIVRTSSWTERWEFAGGGAIPSKVRAGPVEPLEHGFLSQTWSHFLHGTGRWKLDEETLRPVADLRPRRLWPEALDRVESEYPGMEVRRALDSGASDDPRIRWFLRWETLPVNRDRPREGALPEPPMLRVCGIGGSE